MNIPKLIQSKTSSLWFRKKYKDFLIGQKKVKSSIILNNSKRAYCHHTSPTLPSYFNTLNWTEDELQVLGTYKGFYFFPK